MMRAGGCACSTCTATRSIGWALAGDLTAPGGFAQHDANVPRSRLSSLADNDAHVSLARTRAFSWCQCFAVFVPDEVAGDAAWALFQRVRRFWEAQLKEHATRVGQVRAMAEADAVLAEGRTAGLLSVEGLSFLQPGGAAEARLDALAEAGVRMATLVWERAQRDRRRLHRRWRADAVRPRLRARAGAARNCGGRVAFERRGLQGPVRRCRMPPSSRRTPTRAPCAAIRATWPTGSCAKWLIMVALWGSTSAVTF